MKPSTTGGIYKGLAYFCLFLVLLFVWDAIGGSRFSSLLVAISWIGGALMFYWLGSVLEILSDIRAALQANPISSRQSEVHHTLPTQIPTKSMFEPKPSAVAENRDGVPTYQL